jgi:hypothetical protein
MWELHLKGASHAPKDSPLWGSLIKNYKIYKMIFTIISTFYFFKDSYPHMILLQVLIQLTTWNYRMQSVLQKFQSLPLIYFKEKNGWIVNHIHLHLFPTYQTIHQMPLMIFHPPTDRFYIIENVGFDQVYILDLPLLLTQNSYINYS